MERVVTREGLDILSLWQLLVVFSIVVLAIYALGLSENHALHQAFHDFRHAAGFPCH